MAGLGQLTSVRIHGADDDAVERNPIRLFSLSSQTMRNYSWIHLTEDVFYNWNMILKNISTLPNSSVFIQFNRIDVCREQNPYYLIKIFVEIISFTRGSRIFSFVETLQWKSTCQRGSKQYLDILY